MAAPRVERRLAAVMVADVVGYSRLAGRDERGTISRLKILRREVIADPAARYYGTEVNDQSLTPLGPARTGPTRFEDWLHAVPQA